MLKILCCNVFYLVTGMLRWGFDGRGGPCTGEFDYRGCQIPTISPPCPGRGEVGHTIDRCIIHEPGVVYGVTPPTSL